MPGWVPGSRAQPGSETAAVSGMMNFAELSPASSDRLASFAERLRLAVAAYLARFKAPPVSTPNPICAATLPGALSTGWTRC